VKQISSYRQVNYDQEQTATPSAGRLKRSCLYWNKAILTPTAAVVVNFAAYKLKATTNTAPSRNHQQPFYRNFVTEMSLSCEFRKDYVRKTFFLQLP
jgi:hypothetical protein